ncbi:hypothetical protein PVL29_003067 [Vitis rotundifolia]|uniref:BZIP domain-containing protein n=1 Tax=Vitis rotundifolia TaxID=103349 RepID=A0AA39AC05_VITRO|nr:hypothetical protein PVL29_003067 [Vitis rotundifolia]
MKTVEVNTPDKSGKTMEIEDDYVPKSLKPSVTIQVYRRAGATRSPIFPSPVTSSPARHPYFWGNQHCFVPIEGNAIWYPASYHTAPNAYPSISGEFSPTRKRTSVQMIEDGVGVNNSGTAQKVSPNASNVTLSVASATMVRPQEVKQENFIQHEDELRKERKKQANRESAKRSRLRKQEECNKLQAVARTLKSDISILCDKLVRLSEKCMEFERENKSITEELIQTYGLGAISNLEVKYPDFFQQYLDDKRNSNDTEIQSTISMREETPSEDLTSPNQNTEH